MKSCLIILYEDKSADIIKSLESLKNKKILNISEKEFDYLKIDNDNLVEVISSDQCGVGKSTQIKSEFKEEEYIHFPLGGVFNRKDIIRRLKKLEFSNKRVIHLDLYDTDKIDLMLEFLFSILITKIYGQNENIFYLPKNIIIKIEIPNGFIDFKQKFPILTLFPQKTLSINELAPLKVPKDITSNVQVVANYLKALNDNNIDINNKDLYFDKISTPDFLEYETIIKAEVLSQKECQKLIFNEITKTIKVPNYYQITSFIDVLAIQFKKFTRNFFLTANELRMQQQDTSIRTFILESFIKITKYFTEGVFTKIVKAQKKNL
jgi:hypothetical protein